MTLKFDNGYTSLIKRLILLTGFMITLFASPAYCEGGEGKKAEKVEIPGAVYYNLAPPFVVSFKGEKRLRFLRVDITLRLQSSAAEEQVSNHMPRIRNDLIMLFSSQPEFDL